MKRTYTLLATGCGLLFAASTCFAQMYTATDLVTPNTKRCFAMMYVAQGINASGQVVGSCMFGHYPDWAFRTAPNSPITDDLGTLGGSYSQASGINDLGQVVGASWTDPFTGYHAFRTAPNSPISPATDDLGSLDPGKPDLYYSWAYDLNNSGQVVGNGTLYGHAFRTAPNSPINPATDDLGTLGGLYSQASGINDLGQVVGMSWTAGDTTQHAFRTAPNSPINPATDDLGTLGGTYSFATAINNFGEVVGWAMLTGDTTRHAFRTAPSSLINPATDDLGTFGGTYSVATGINSFGQVVGGATLTGDTVLHSFLYSGGVMHDLNDLIPANFGCELSGGGGLGQDGINDAGQIVTTAGCLGEAHVVRLDPIYKAFVQPPINADGSSIFKTKRGTVPVKFRLTQYGAQTCTLLPATIAITRAAGGKLRSVDENKYGRGSGFKITGCQYHYNLEAKQLKAGVYRVDISINGIMVGHAVFAVK